MHARELRACNEGLCHDMDMIGAQAQISGLIDDH